MRESSDDLRPVTLTEAFNEYLRTLKSDQRALHERYVRHYVQAAGESQLTTMITGARVEWYAETHIKGTDPLADERVAALKAWFQFLKKRNHTSQNYGAVIRVRRTGTRQPAGQGRTVSGQPSMEMTVSGAEAMQRELEELNRQVPRLIDAIAVAREDKDFRENAPLDAAREALAQNESRRKRLESDLKRIRVVDDSSADDRAGVGSAVTVVRTDSGNRFTYRLVGAREANARENKISVESPVGRELLGKRAGDDVVVRAPNGEIHYRVEDVSPS